MIDSALNLEASGVCGHACAVDVWSDLALAAWAARVVLAVLALVAVWHLEYLALVSRT